jgi:hypothetical protein
MIENEVPLRSDHFAMSMFRSIVQMSQIPCEDIVAANTAVNHLIPTGTQFLA